MEKTTFNLFILLQASCFVTNKQIPCSATHNASLFAETRPQASFFFINHQAEITYHMAAQIHSETAHNQFQG